MSAPRKCYQELRDRAVRMYGPVCNPPRLPVSPLAALRKRLTGLSCNSRRAILAACIAGNAVRSPGSADDATVEFAEQLLQGQIGCKGNHIIDVPLDRTLSTKKPICCACVEC